MQLTEYTVKIKDRKQNCTHTVHQLAYSQNEANSIVLEWLRKALGHSDFEVR